MNCLYIKLIVTGIIIYTSKMPNLGIKGSKKKSLRNPKATIMLMRFITGCAPDPLNFLNYVRALIHVIFNDIHCIGRT